MAELKVRPWPYVVAFGVLVLDRATKAWAEAGLAPGDSITVIPGFFSIVHWQNRGAAFGLFSESNSQLTGALLLLISLATLVFVAGLLWQLARVPGPTAKRALWALALLLGGALGNVYDRIAKGSVTDFLDFSVAGHHWPTFNVADSAITIGAVLLAWELLSARRGRAT